MDSDDLRNFASDSDDNDSADYSYGQRNNIWKTTNSAVEQKIDAVPSFFETKSMYAALHKTGNAATPHLTGGFCYYLGVLDGPEGTPLAPGHKKRHLVFLDKRLRSTAKRDFCLLLKKYELTLAELLRVYISCMYFGDTDASRPEVSKWYGTDETVDAEGPGTRYTPFQQFSHHNAAYISEVAKQMCPEGVYQINPEDTKGDVILETDVRYALETVLWKLMPDVEKASYQH